MLPSDVVELVVGLSAGYVIMQVLPVLWELLQEYYWRSRQPLLVVTRCEIGDGQPRTVLLEGRVTTLKGKFFPRLAESASATVLASADGFEVKSAGHTLRNARIEAEEVCGLEHDPATVAPVYISCATLASVFFFVFSTGWLTGAMLAALLIAMGIGGLVFELHRSYLLVVNGDQEKAIVLRMTATDTRVRLDRGFEALFDAGCAALDKRYPDVRPGTMARSGRPRRKATS